METRADEVYSAHLRLGRFLPLPLVVALSLARGIVLGFIFGGGEAASAYVVVTRRSDGSVVGRLSAGREAHVGESLLQSVQATMRELSPAEFLPHWHLTEG